MKKEITFLKVEKRIIKYCFALYHLKEGSYYIDYIRNKRLTKVNVVIKYN